ncbi:MAG: zinc ribbon domain-containing protein [Lachnospiraceae bacterium]|nr:zinc ribbon domain-containing protein [Lachnospiraceae bacterium]
MYCRQCGKKIKKEAKFCSHCGQKIKLQHTSRTVGASSKNCSNCGAANHPRESFCRSCGTPFLAVQDMRRRNGRQNYRLLWMSVGVAIAVVVVGMVGLLLWKYIQQIETQTQVHPLVYLKDNDIYGVKKNGESYLVSRDGFRHEEESGKLLLHREIQFTQDGQYLFYAKNNEANNSYAIEFDLCRRVYGKEDAEEIVIDSSVLDFCVLDKDHILYKKTQEADLNVLYYLDLENKVELAQDVAWFGVSRNGQYIFWLRKDDNRYVELYVQDSRLKKSAIKIDSNIRYFRPIHFSEDFSQIVYEKEDGSLYIVNDLSRKEKIASYVSEYSEYPVVEKDHLKFYYTITEPYDSVTLIPDDERDKVMDIDLPMLSYQKIYYYNGKTKKSILLKEGIVTSYLADNQENSTIGRIYTILDPKKLKPMVYLSEIEGLYQNELHQKLEDIYAEQAEVYLFHDSKVIELEIDLQNYSCQELDIGKNSYSLVLVGKIGKKMDSSQLFFTKLGQADKLKLIDQTRGNFERVELSQEDTIVYLKNWENEMGDLYFYQAKEPEKIGDEVIRIESWTDGRIVFTKNGSSYGRDLYSYETGKVIDVDSNIIRLLNHISYLKE